MPYQCHPTAHLGIARTEHENDVCVSAKGPLRTTLDQNMNPQRSMFVQDALFGNAVAPCVGALWALRPPSGSWRAVSYIAIPARAVMLDKH